MARVAADCAARGIGMVDAPLARRPVEAEADRLGACVGAEPAAFDAIRPVLDGSCENIFHKDPAGSGIRTKPINNLITLGRAALIAGAPRTCAATGVDLHKFHEVISAGGGNSGMFQMIAPAILEEGSFEGKKFTWADGAAEGRLRARTGAAIGPPGPAAWGISRPPFTRYQTTRTLTP